VLGERGGYWWLGGCVDHLPAGAATKVIHWVHTAGYGAGELRR